MDWTSPNGRKIVLQEGDITRIAVDAMANAANSALAGGGGVDGAIHRADGPELAQYCRRLGGCDVGDAKTTPGFRLKAKWVIHTVGPVWDGGGYGEDELLASCYRNAVKLAIKQDLKSIAFPAISTGVYGFPIDRAAAIAVRQVKQMVQSCPDLRVVFCCFGQDAIEAYREALADSEND